MADFGFAGDFVLVFCVIGFGFLVGFLVCGYWCVDLIALCSGLFWSFVDCCGLVRVLLGWCAVVICCCIDCLCLLVGCCDYLLHWLIVLLYLQHICFACGFVLICGFVWLVFSCRL